MAMDHETAKGTNIDTLKEGLDGFRNIVVSNFGDKLEYSFMKAEKKFTSDPDQKSPSNTTTVLMQLSNKKEFGVFEVLFDDKSNKILNIKALEVKEPVPNMVIYWLFGLVALCVFAFNIYMIRKVKLSKMKKKWQKYLAIVILNVPAIGYKAVGGFFINPLSFQILLGLSFEKMGYLGSSWTFGIPLGGLYVLWKLNKGMYDPKEKTEVNEPIELESK
jgi:hypothetical protein